MILEKRLKIDFVIEKSQNFSQLDSSNELI